MPWWQAAESVSPAAAALERRCVERLESSDLSVREHDVSSST